MEASTENVTYDRQRNENQIIIDGYIEARKTEANISRNFQRLIMRTVNYLTRHTNKNLKILQGMILFLSQIL